MQAYLGTVSGRPAGSPWRQTGMAAAPPALDGHPTVDFRRLRTEVVETHAPQDGDGLFIGLR